MGNTVIRFEAAHEAFPGLHVGFDVPVPSAAGPSEEDRHSASFASDGVLRAFAHGAAARAQEAASSLSAMSGGRTRLRHAFLVASLSAVTDSMTARRFKVAMPDGSMAEADARDFADASLVAAARLAMEGMSLADLVQDAGLVADRLVEIRAANTQGPVVEGEHCSFGLRDWRVAEGEGDSLTDAQAEPFEFTLVSGGYGPAALLRRGDESYSVSMEVDEGCIAVHMQGPGSDNAIATVRLSREAMQASLSSGDGQDHEAYLVGETVTRDLSGQKLTQDGPAATAPSA